MELNTGFIKDQFKGIALRRNLKWTKEDSYEMKLENDKVQIYFFTERWEEGIGLGLINKQTNEYYNYSLLMTKKGFTQLQDFLSISETAQKDMMSEDDALIYSFALLLEQHYQNPLAGNFSEIGSGKRN